MHNKFSHWSGVGVGPTSACHPDRRTTPLTDAQQQGGVATGRREEWEEPAEAGPGGLFDLTHLRHPTVMLRLAVMSYLGYCH